MPGARLPRRCCASRGEDPRPQRPSPAVDRRPPRGTRSRDRGPRWGSGGRKRPRGGVVAGRWGVASSYTPRGGGVAFWPLGPTIITSIGSLSRYLGVPQLPHLPHLVQTQPSSLAGGSRKRTGELGTRRGENKDPIKIWFEKNALIQGWG